MKAPRSRSGGDVESFVRRKPDPVDDMVELDGGSIAVRRFAPSNARKDGGPTLVFLHEALGCCDMWKRWPQRLAEETGLPFLAYDRYGHGGSAALTRPRRPDYLEAESWEVLPGVLEACGVTDPILYGHSDGGTIALMHASRFRTRAVITEAAHVFVEEATRAGIREAVEAWRDTGIRQRLARYHGDRTEALFFAWADTWLSDEFASWNIEDRLPDVTCPVLAAQGEDDEYGTMAQVDAVVAGVSGPVSKLLLPDCRHIPYLQAEGRLLPPVRAFIAGCLD